MKFQVGDIVWAKQPFSSEFPALIIEPEKDTKQVHVSFFPKHQTAYLAKKNIWPFLNAMAMGFIKKKGIREAVEWAAEYAHSNKERYHDIIPFFEELLDGEYLFVPVVQSSDNSYVPSCSNAVGPRDSTDPDTPQHPTSEKQAVGLLEESDTEWSADSDDNIAPASNVDDLTTMRGTRPFTVVSEKSDGSDEEAERINDPDYHNSSEDERHPRPPMSKHQRKGKYIVRASDNYSTSVDAVMDQIRVFDTSAIEGISALVLENIITTIEHAEKAPLTRKRHRKETAKEARKRMRNSGQAYHTKTGKTVEEKTFSRVTCKCPNGCGGISTGALEEIFRGFWSRAYADQQSFLLKHVSRQPVKRRRTAPATSQKNFTLRYTLTISGNPVQVCRNVFRKTLSVTESRIQHLLRRDEAQQGITPEDKRGKHPCSFKTETSRLEEVRQFLRHLPSNDSHYRRSDTSKIYLQPGLSIRALHHEYSRGAEIPVAFKVFSNVFNNEFNYSFEPPRNDVCDECHAYSIASAEEKQTLQEQHDSHLRRMKQAFQAKREDTAIARTDSTVAVATFDMEKILVTPCTPVSNMHYKRKLSTFNFTVWNNASNTVTCYVWNQTTGKKGSAETSTALFKWLNSLSPMVRRVVLYSDTAGGQNRNRALVAMFSHFLTTTKSSIESIEHKYMESGHSHMEVDSAHSAIERASRNRHIYVPADWVKVMVEKGYTVIQPSIGEWLNFPAMAEAFLRNRKRTSGGDVVNWLKLKVMLYSKKDVEAFYVKYEIEDINYLRIPFDMSSTRQSKFLLSTPPKSMYSVSALPVPKLKLRDLLQMAKKYVIAEDRHFYENLVADDDEDEEEEDL